MIGSTSSKYTFVMKWKKNLNLIVCKNQIGDTGKNQTHGLRKGDAEHGH